ncbi:MAG TPA: substrate-binding domain-containing protein [Chthoniobacteraceae bacterium]|nr:substrate-binding domain-containing protein [Chthoniobacteraceae bacterium]
MSGIKPLVLLLTENADLRRNQIAKGVLKACHALGWEMRWRENRSLEKGLEKAQAVITSMKVSLLENVAGRVPPGVPLVSVDGDSLETGIPTVAPDQKKIGKVTALHFLEQGLINFAFVGTLTHPSAHRRKTAFQETIAQHLSNYTMADFHVPHEDRFWSGNSALGRSFLRFLRKRPLPVGIMVASDHAAISCLESLIEAGFRCPLDVAVVGANDDPIYTALVMPLSSIRIDFERIGELAVDVIRRKLSAETKPVALHEPVLGELIVRRSSQLRMMADERISRAVEILQTRYTERLTLAALAKLCGMSRASFEAKFVEAIGVSPIRYLINYRLERANYLLAETNLSIKQITERIGFGEQTYFTRAFRKKFGRPPSEHRQFLLGKR